MIYTITFNPALDYIIHIDDYCEGIVNRTSEEKFLPGGKGINVSVVLKNLGIDSTAMGYTAGFTGKEIERMLAQQGVTTDFIQLLNGMSRINVKLKSKVETEINAQGPQISKEAINELLDKLSALSEGDYLVLAGSIPKSVPDSIYCDIMKLLHDKKINFVVDAEKSLLMNTLEHKPFLIKPNHHELGEIFSKELKDKKEIAEYACILQQRGAKNVFVSMSKAGGLLVTEDGKTMFCTPPEGNVVNSTGAGDSAVAGFLAGYINSGNYEEALLLGLCSGSASAFSQNLATKEEIEKLYADMSRDMIEYI